MNYNSSGFDRELPGYGGVITLGQYTARTFLWMVLGLMITFGVAIFTWMTGVVYYVLQFQFILLIATLILSVTMSVRIERMSVGTAIGMFVAFSALFGLTMSVYLVIFALPSVILVFLMTAIYFGALALYGHFTKADLSGFRTILFSGLIFLVVAALLSMLIPGFSAMDRLLCIVGIAIFLGYTAYDTQQIRNYYYYYSGYPDMMEKASIFSALQLYLDFLNLFVYLLRFLGKRRD